MSTSATTAGDLRWYQGIDRKLWIILAVTYVGWLLDSMDLNLFTVVLVPSLRELLGPQAGPQTIGYYGGAIVAVQLLGWGVGGLIFGILGDYRSSLPPDNAALSCRARLAMYAHSIPPASSHHIAQMLSGRIGGSASWAQCRFSTTGCSGSAPCWIVPPRRISPG